MGFNSGLLPNLYSMSLFKIVKHHALPEKMFIKSFVYAITVEGVRILIVLSVAKRVGNIIRG